MPLSFFAAHSQGAARADPPAVGRFSGSGVSLRKN